ncbi:uncharacterized protein LOC109856929 [Pseudomyrmex gracilis]|uniref:uncharacterized protein LOC109856929 n=1 Tax=Pseudomyrmex gracilis TaxID=219809 RepID=UPI000994F88B|nr:uncharacterized protein LOC109856929 [Pseudomyrmex gracilis]
MDKHQLEDFTQQTEGQLEFGQQSDDQQSGKVLQHIEKLEQRTPRSNSLAQQTVDKVEIGHHSNQHLEDLTQQNEQFAEQTQGSNYFTQQTSGKLTFGQQTVGEHQLEDLTQNSDEQFTQQTEGQLEFGQHSVGNQHLEDFTQKNKQFDNDFTQQTMGHIEFGRPEIEDLTQQENEDLTQQTGGFDDFTQQTSGHHQSQEHQQRPSWSEYNTQHMGQFSQQTDWNANILPHRRPSHTNEPSDQWQLEQMSQQTDFDRDFTQQTDHQSAPKPAPKPKPRPRYHQHAYIPSEKDTNIDNTYKLKVPIEVHSEPDIDTPEGTSTSDYRRSQVVYSHNPGTSVYNNGEENLDRLHWIHKSNDASVGLQWHYTYHPSDLINVEGTYYGPNINPTSQHTQETQQQSNQFDFSQQETQDKHVFEQNQQLGSSQQIETSHSENQFNQNSEEIPARVIPLQNSQRTTELEKQRVQVAGQTEEPQIEPRILQAFGGGPYDPSHTDDTYSKVTINPSATLPPIYIDDPWDIREKPREMIPWVVAHTMSTENTPKPIDTTTPVVETTTPITETTTGSFWNKLGRRLTVTYGKAKEKAKEIFG